MSISNSGKTHIAENDIFVKSPTALKTTFGNDLFRHFRTPTPKRFQERILQKKCYSEVKQWNQWIYLGFPYPQFSKRWNQQHISVFVIGFCDFAL